MQVLIDHKVQSVSLHKELDSLARDRDQVRHLVSRINCYTRRGVVASIEHISSFVIDHCLCLLGKKKFGRATLRRFDT